MSESIPRSPALRRVLAVLPLALFPFLVANDRFRGAVLDVFE